MLNYLKKLIEDHVINKSYLKKQPKEDNYLDKIREVINSEEFERRLIADQNKSKELNEVFYKSAVENKIRLLFENIYKLKKETYSSYELKKSLESMIATMDEMRYYYNRDEWEEIAINAFDTQFFKFEDAAAYLPENLGTEYSENPSNGERLLNFHINMGLFETAKRVELKNYEIIKEYKRKDKIGERFEVIQDTARMCIGFIQSADNQRQIHQDLRAIIDRATDRGFLYKTQRS